MVHPKQSYQSPPTRLLANTRSKSQCGSTASILPSAHEHNGLPIGRLCQFSHQFNPHNSHIVTTSTQHHRQISNQYHYKFYLQAYHQTQPLFTLCCPTFNSTPNSPNSSSTYTTHSHFPSSINYCVEPNVHLHLISQWTNFLQQPANPTFQLSK